MIASAKGDLTIVTPAVYLTSLAEIARSDRSVVVWPGLNLDTYFQRSEDPVNRKIRKQLVYSFEDPTILTAHMKLMMTGLSKAVQHGRRKPADTKSLQNMGKLYPSLRRNISIMESSAAAGNVAGWVCMLSGYDPRIDFKIIRLYAPGRNFGLLIGLSRNISRPVRARIYKIMPGLFESGISTLDIRATTVLDPQGFISRGQLIPCFDAAFSRKSESGGKTQDLPLSAYHLFFEIIFVCFACCTIIWACEIMYHICRQSDRRYKRERREKLHAIHLGKASFWGRKQVSRRQVIGSRVTSHNT